MQPIQSKSCFVASPIGAEYSDVRMHADWIYQEIISHVLDRDFSDIFTVTRADKINAPGMIDGQIINHLLDDDLVVADLSRLNPNVFYEIGIRHMVEKPIIHIHQTGTEIPFDIKPFRSVEFSYADPQSLLKARVAFKLAVQSVLSDDYTVSNPVIVARGIQKLHESASPASELLIAELQQIAQRLARLEAKDSQERAVKAALSAQGSDSVARALWASQPTKELSVTQESKDTLTEFFESIQTTKAALADLLNSIEQRKKK